MLQPPRYSDNCDEQQESKQHMGEGYPQSGYKEPDNIEQGEQAPWQLSLVYPEGPAERPETKRSDFDQLEPEGYADDCGHHHHATQKVADGGGQSPEYKPDQVTQEIQILQINWSQ